LLRVLALTDLHGQLESRVWTGRAVRAVGGSAALRPWLDSLAKGCRCTSVRLDAGDEMQGTPVSNISYGRGVVAVMNALGIDAAAIGNHEFDWSIDTLLARMQDARLQVLSANITESVRSAPPDWALPWTLITRNGVRSPSSASLPSPRRRRRHRATCAASPSAMAPRPSAVTCPTPAPLRTS